MWFNISFRLEEQKNGFLHTESIPKKTLILEWPNSSKVFKSDLI